MATDPNNPYAEILAEEEEQRTALFMRQHSQPDRVAEANRIARTRGVAPTLLDEDLPTHKANENVTRTLEVFGQYPAFGRWASANPRGAAAAQDDHESLGMLGRAWEVLKGRGAQTGNMLGEQATAFSAGVSETLDAINYPFRAVAATIVAPFGLKDDPDADWNRRRAQERANREGFRAGAQAADKRAQTGNYWIDKTTRGLASVLPSLLATAASIATKNPTYAMGIMGGGVGAQSYQKARDEGLGVGTSATYAFTQGGTEALTEMIPAIGLVGDLLKGTGFGKTILRQFATEIPGENVATAVQDFSDWATLPENADKTLGDYIRARPEAALQTTLATIGGTGAQTSIAVATDRAVKAAINVGGRVQQASQARQEARFFDRASKAAESSKLRTRDPEAFREAVRAQAEEAGTEYVHISGEAAQAYYQSDSYDPDSDPFAVYEDQVNEAAATGGDVVIPIADALTDLVGTGAWEALRPDMRLTPGGQSPREAETFDAGMEDIMAEMTDQMAADEKSGQASKDTRTKLVDGLAAQLQNAGTSPVTARQQAELAATRVQARAARNGQELTGEEFDRIGVVGVDRTTTLSTLRARGDKTATAQALMNSAGVNPEDFANVAETQAAGTKPNGGVGGPSLVAMLTAMGRAATENPQIFDSIVELIPVNVMNDLALTKGAAKRLLHDKAVLENAAALDTELAVAGGGDSAATVRLLVNEIARVAAKATSGPVGARGRAAKSDGAAIASLDSQFNDSSAQRAMIQFFGDFGSDLSSIKITLFESKNVSSFLHELGHLWLEELRFDAAQSDAPAQLKADWQTVTDWFAANGHPVTDGQIPVEAHELWARSHERYLMEGKSPVAALKRIFETFRGWLTGIYKTVDALKAPISPEIREVFDRLIATDEEIAAANERQNLAALFKQAADAAMSAQEFEAYQAQVTAARAEAQGKLLDKTMRSVRAKATKAWNDEAAGIREQVTAEVNDLPLFRALRAMKTDRISAEWVKAEGFDSAALPVRVPPLTKPGGADPELIAELAGFATAGDMLRTLIKAESIQRQSKEGGDPRSMRVRVIEVAVENEMARRHGDALNDGSIEREALEAVHNDMQGEVIATELRVLSRKSGKRATPYALAKEWARNRVRSGKVVDEASPAAIQRYARAASKAGRAAQDAMLKGDVDETFRQKNFQMLNNALVSEANAAHDEVQAAVKRLGRVAKAKTMKSVDQDYLEQAQALLEAVDLRPRSQVSQDKQGAWEAWAAERTAEGFDVVVPGSFEAVLGKTNYTRLPVEDLLSLDEAVKQAIHLGRYKQTLLDNKERREFEEVVNEALGGMGEGKPPSDLMEPSFWDRAKSRVAAIDAALLKMETVFDWLDGGNSNGVFNRIVFRPIAEAQHNATVRMAEMAEKLNAALEAVPAKTVKRWREKVSGPLLNRETGNPFVFTRDQLVSLALNMGNRGNIDKLTGGYGWNEQSVRDFLNAELTAEEWTYVQTVWDTIDELWPEIEALEKRLNGVAPDKVEAEPVETPGGTLRGGYFPVVYDPRRNYDAEANAAKGRGLFENIYTRATTPKGFTKERTRVERPIHLSLGIISRHVAEVVHDITHREAIMQADKFLADKRIMRAVDETLGPEVRKQFRPWLQRIANQWAYDRAGTAGLEGFINKMRTNATVVGMGFRVSTMLMQAAGFSNSFEVVGERWLAPAIARVAAHPVESFEFVMSRSGEVPTRMANLDRDIRDAARSAGGLEKLSAVKRYAFHGIGYMDRVVVIPTWLGAYDKAIAGGMSEEEAIYAADKAVRQSQGSGAAKDLAAVQSGRGTAGAALKLLTMFYSYMSAFYQRERTLGRDIARGGVKDVPKLLARAWWLVVVPPLLAELLAGRGPGDDDDDETWASWALESIGLSLVGPIPLARDVVPLMVRKFKDQPSFGYRFTPAQGGVESLLRIADDTERLADGKKTRRLTQSAIETVGYFTGLTTGQIAAATQFLVDVGQDEVDPEGFGDWWEGLTKGKIKAD